jgi:septum formation protein
MPTERNHPANIAGNANASNARLILGSSSPYRRELLSRLGLPFEVIAPDIDETALPGEAPETTALRLAQEKARAIGLRMPAGGALIIGSDQVATLDGEQIGKPGNHENALRQLQKMRGRRVIFHTALCLWDSTGPAPVVQTDNVQTFVTFRDLPDHELDAYLRIEQPYDCAGSAKNEGLGIAILEKIESSDPTALTGLPLIALSTMLRKRGVVFFATQQNLA